MLFNFSIYRKNEHIVLVWLKKAMNNNTSLEDLSKRLIVNSNLDTQVLVGNGIESLKRNLTAFFFEYLTI